jgi:hypothetical protein
VTTEADALVERDIIIRAINNVLAKHVREVGDGRAEPRPTWCHVKNLFGYGSTISVGICRRYGLDPDAYPWLLPDPETQE